MSLSPNETPAPKMLTSVMEDYLETIFNLEIDKKVVRVKDIAGKLKVKMPSVTSMLKTLSERGLVNYEKYEYVLLTDEGTAIGREINRRHGLLFKFLTDVLQVDPAKAADEACRMEHVLSHDTMERLMFLMQATLECPDCIGKTASLMKNRSNDSNS